MLYNVTCYRDKESLFNAITLIDEKKINDLKIRNIKLILLCNDKIPDNIIEYIVKTRIGECNTCKEIPLKIKYCYILTDEQRREK